MTYNAGERAHVRSAEKLQARLQREKAEVVRGLMSTSSGRAWIHGILESANVFATTFDRDALAMAFAEGQRNQGLILLNDVLSFCPEQYVLMMREANERYLASQRARGENGNRGTEEPSGPAPDGDPGLFDERTLDATANFIVNGPS